MACAGCRFVAACLVAVTFAGPLMATDTEYREFSIFVNGKEAGFSKMTIVQNDDGSSYMSATVTVRFRQLISDFNLKAETQEWWKNGRLTSMKTSSTENGKKTDVQVWSDNNQMRIRINGQDRFVSPDVWTGSYWKLADARFHNKQVPVLEVDSGKESNCELKYIGDDNLKVGGQLQACYHFRVSGGTGPVDLWFDRYHRLVRQEFTELGHKTIVQLISVRR